MASTWNVRLKPWSSKAKNYDMASWSVQREKSERVKVRVRAHLF
jgi:hypothetical protein